MNYILQTHFKMTRRGMMRKRKVTSGLLQEKSNFVITLNPESNVPREETLPILIKHIDVTATHTSLDVMMEKHVEDCWNVDGEKRIVRCMDWLHKICSVKGKATGRICMVRGETHEKAKIPLVQTRYGQKCGSICLMQQRRKRNPNSTMPGN